VFYGTQYKLGPLTRFTFEVVEGLYGVTNEKSFTATGGLHDVRDGLIWLVKNEQGLLIVKTHPNCLEISPDFHSKLIEYLRSAKKTGSNGARVYGYVHSYHRSLKAPIVRLEGEKILETRADENGKFQFENVPPGRYQARGVAQPYVMDRNNPVIDVAALSCRTESLSFTMRGANTISGWIEAQSFHSGKHVDVIAQRRDSASDRRQVGVNLQNGRNEFAVGDLEPGAYNLTAKLFEPGLFSIFPHETEKLSIELGREPLREVKLALYPRQKRKVVVQFNDAEGKPIANAEIWRQECDRPVIDAVSGMRRFFRRSPAGSTNPSGQLILNVYEYSMDHVCWASGALKSETASEAKVLQEDTSVTIVLK
jgi:hypothetical protein